MAPIVRTASQGTGGVGKKVHRKRAVRREPSDGWTFNLSTTNGAARDHQGDEGTPDFHSPTDVDVAVAPLRAMAEKVGKEVETFAETLDKFFTALPTTEDRFGAAFDLVLNFKNIANDVVEKMKSRHDRELRQQLRQEWNEQARISSGSSAPRSSVFSTSAALSNIKAAQVEELRTWQQEADLWDLFGTMLELHPFESEAQEKRREIEEQLARLGPPNRYTSEGDLWERFLLEDNLAKERHDIKLWLERTAEHQQSDLQDVIEELEKSAGRGKGLWSSGWLHTREKIKGEKRIRSWPNAAESPLPQIKRSDNNELLVTTLDPDAASRQQRTLEKPDSHFERAMWIACWEMLRRGTSPQAIAEWCEERKDGWRGVSIGAALDHTEATVSTAAFRRVCRLAAQSGHVNDHEAAVFGLLGGDVKAVDKVCRTVDDHLYAYYSGTLLKQFDNYLLSVCPDKGVPRKWQHGIADDSVYNPEQAEAAIQDLIMRLRKRSTTSKEAAQPMKIIQSYLLADEVGSLVHTVGAAVAQAASLRGPEDLIFMGNRQAWQDGVQLPEAEVALDPQTLRMAVHMSLVHRALSPNYLTDLEGDELLEDENVIVAYIQALRAAGKRDLIPIYASKLQKARYIIVLGQTLQDITDPQEQERTLALLGEYHLDTISILTEQMKLVFEHSFDRKAALRPLKMLERTDDTKLHPGQRIIVGFLGEEAKPDDEAIVRCLQWFRHMRGGWKLTFEALAVALRNCLLTGRMTCAQMIVRAFPYEDVSLRKSYETIGRSIDVMDNTTAEPRDDGEAMSWEFMRRHSKSYYELDKLVNAIMCLSQWRTEEHTYVSKVPKPPNVPSAVKRAYAAVTTAMKPILDGILQHPEDDAERHDFDFIRVNYLPEVVIAYNTVLHASGNLITRDSLLESMELSVAIANGDKRGEENHGLQECFVKAGRMRELVESFALTSKVMLILKAEGKEWKARKERRGTDLGIWEIGGKA